MEQSERISLEQYVNRISDKIKTYRKECRRRGSQVELFEGELDEFNEKKGEEYEIIDVCERCTEPLWKRYFGLINFLSLHVYYHRPFRKRRCLEGLGFIGAEALIRFRKGLFTSYGIPVRRKIPPTKNFK